MTELLAGEVHPGAACSRQGAVRVPQVMDSERRIEAGGLYRERMPAVADVGIIQGRSRVRREDESVCPPGRATVHLQHL
jgi:hypothetical protein